MDSVPVSVTDSAAKPTADGLLPSVTMTAGRLRKVDAKRPGILKELLVSLGATGAIPQSDVQDQTVVVVDDDEPTLSCSSGKRSKKGRKRKRQGHDTQSGPAGQTARKGSLGIDEQRGMDGSGGRGETGDEQCGSAKRAKKNRRKTDQRTMPEGQPAKGSRTIDGVKKRSKRAHSGGIGEVGADVTAVSSAGVSEKKRKIKKQQAASRSDDRMSPSATIKSDEIETTGSGDTTASGIGIGRAGQNDGDNPAGDTSPTRARKKRRKATEGTFRSAQPVQPDGSMAGEKRGKKKKKGAKKTAAVGREPESSHGRQENSTQDIVAGTKDMSVIDLSSDSSAAQVKKAKKKIEEKLRCSDELDGLTEGATERKRRKAAEETRESSSNSSSEAQEGKSRPERKLPNSIPESGTKGTKKKRKRRERKEAWKASGGQAHSDTAMPAAADNGPVGEVTHISSLVRDEASQRDRPVEKTVTSVIVLTSDSSATQDQKKKKKNGEKEEVEHKMKKTKKQKMRKKKTTKKAEEP